MNDATKQAVAEAPNPIADERKAAALSLRNVIRRFDQGGAILEVLSGASLTIDPGELVALVGPSGAGKSTLLHIAGLLEKADGGAILIGGENCSEMSDQQRTRTRLSRIGFVYQHHHLLPEFSALENVMIPQMIGNLPRSEARKRSKELLAMVGLTERENHRPARLSGGEQQRAAIARALANAPDLLLADEPTGNLDHHTTETVFELMVRLVRGVGLAALVATHNLEIAARMDRVLILKDGRVERA